MPKLKQQWEEREHARLSDKQRLLLKMKDLLYFLNALFGHSGIKRTELLRIRSAICPSVFFSVLFTMWDLSRVSVPNPTGLTQETAPSGLDIIASRSLMTSEPPGS